VKIFGLGLLEGVGVAVDREQRGVVEIARRAVENDFAAAQADHPIGETASESDLVEAHNRRDPGVAADTSQQREQLERTRGIKAGDRFIGEEETRFLGECARDADALLFAAAELVGALQRFVQQADPIEAGQGEATVPRRQCERTPETVMTETAREDVAQGGAIRNELVLLKNHSGPTSVTDDVGARW
jgi:hypothetical protein